MRKTRSFRPTKESNDAIDFLIEHKKVESVTEAVNKLIEDGLEAPPKTKAIFQLESEEPKLPEWLDTELQRFLRGKKSKAIQFLFSNASTAYVRGVG